MSFASLAFTDPVKRLQEAAGSRAAYARQQAAHPDAGARLGPDEAAFIEARDSCFLATVSVTGWPYVQHRGGAPGFIRVLDPSTIGFADLRGNRQYITTGNLADDDRVAMIFVDYAAQARLKLLGRARVIPTSDEAWFARVPPPPGARAERGIEIHIEAVDWNCSQHIPQKFSLAEVEAALAHGTVGR